MIYGKSSFVMHCCQSDLTALCLYNNDNNNSDSNDDDDDDDADKDDNDNNYIYALFSRLKRILYLLLAEYSWQPHNAARGEITALFLVWSKHKYLLCFLR